ncbi:hypothetical protein MHU86_25426 [Fragilaria crotonensis]|nr:hypothetical protein MHU86_25426 [Fragilaria crotonensis]
MRNLQTGSISPQFHVVFDERSTGTLVKLFISERDYYGPDEEEENDDVLAFPDIDPDWLPLAKLVHPDPVHVIAPEDTTTPPPHVSERADAVQVEPIANPTPERDDCIHHDAIDPPPHLHHRDMPERPRRIRRPNQRVFGDEWANQPHS